MAKRELDLRDLLDVQAWEGVQDRLAELTGTAIITIDYKGTPITKHSGRTEFCGVIRENPIFCKRCHRCDALAGLEAVRLGRPYIYLCHCGIVDVAVPVVVGDRYLGAVMFGQVRISNGDTGGKVERLVSEISQVPQGKEESYRKLIELYGRLPEMEYSRILEIAQLMESLVGYLVDREIRHRNDTQTYQWLLRMGKGPGRKPARFRNFGSRNPCRTGCQRRRECPKAVRYIRLWHISTAIWGSR